MPKGTPTNATEITAAVPGGTNDLNFAVSGDTSSVFTHFQSAYIAYEQVSISRPDGNWPPSCETAAKFKCYLNYNVRETITEWATSSSASGAASAAPANSLNSRSCGSATVFSFDSSVGLGTSGYVEFGAGYYTRAANSSDFSYVRTGAFNDILITTPLGTGSGLGNDQRTAEQFVQRVNTAIRTGGFEYSTDGTAGGVTMTVEELGWWPELLC